MANRICKYVLCSTYQISISCSELLTLSENKNDNNNGLAMACTARGTDKEMLSAISEIPLLLELNKNKIVWFGQLYNDPTSEYLSHWSYHKLVHKIKDSRNLILHFHPVNILELYDLFKDHKITKNEFFTEITTSFKGKDLNFNIHIVGSPTVREPDGLAMSSRNIHLTDAQRLSATSLYRSLVMAQSLVESGTTDAAAVISAAVEMITACPDAAVDYIAVCDPDTLEDIAVIEGLVLMALAAKIGNTRLIDNMMLIP